MRITAVIKMRNEEGEIASLFANLKDFASDIIIVDDSSTDHGKDLAVALGATVLHGKPHGGKIDLMDYHGFCAVREGYILRIDANDRLEDGLKGALLGIARGNVYDGVLLGRRYVVFGKQLNHGGFLQAQEMRFFKAESWDRSWNCVLHSQVPVIGKIKKIKPERNMCLLHNNYKSVAEYVNRGFLNYSAREAFDHKSALTGKPLSLRWSIVRIFMKKFVGRYIIKCGFRDGHEGFAATALLAMYDSLVVLRVWDTNRRSD